MAKGWKTYVQETGLRSLENSEVEERGYFRLKIFLKNTFKERYAEEKSQTKSFLYQLVMSLKMNKTKIDKNVEMDGQLDEFYIDNQKLILRWNKIEGITIIPETVKGNPLITEIETMIKTSTIEI